MQLRPLRRRTDVVDVEAVSACVELFVRLFGQMVDAFVCRFVANKRRARNGLGVIVRLFLVQKIGVQSTGCVKPGCVP